MLAQVFIRRGDERSTTILGNRRQIGHRHLKRRAFGPVIGRPGVGMDAKAHELLPRRQHFHARHRAVKHVKLGRLDLVKGIIGAERQQDLRRASDAFGRCRAQHVAGEGGQMRSLAFIEHINVDADQGAAEQAGIGAVALGVGPAGDFGLVGRRADGLPGFHDRTLPRRFGGHMRAKDWDGAIGVAMEGQAQVGEIIRKSGCHARPSCSAIQFRIVLLRAQMSDPILKCGRPLVASPVR